MKYTEEAARHVSDLIAHYERKQRPEAVLNLLIALRDAERRIATSPESGIAAPRPYPTLAKQGEAWLKAGRYWVNYALSDPPEIRAVFFETSDIPGRL